MRQNHTNSFIINYLGLFMVFLFHFELVKVLFGEEFKMAFVKLNCQCLNPHFSPAFYCGGGSRHINCVALGRAPRHTVEYACGALGRAGWKTARRALYPCPSAPPRYETCFENILNRNPSESASEFGIAIRNDRLPTATPIPTPNYTIAPSSRFHASPGAPRRVRNW
jgi:hypothetical protein